MQGKSIGKRLWEMVSPILIHMGITFVVEFVVIFAMMFAKLPEFMDDIQDIAITDENYMEMVSETSIQLMNDILPDILQYALAMTAVSALIALPIFEWMRRRDRKADLLAGIAEMSPISMKRYLWIVGISIPVAVGLNNLLLLANLAAYSEMFQATAELLAAPSMPMQILCCGIIIPIVEEYMFRGLIQRRMRRYMSPKKAILLSALLFGFYHGNLVQFIYGFLCGLLLAWLYETYGSLKAPIFSHMIMNTFVLVLDYFGGFEWMFAKPMRMAVVTVLCATVVSSLYLAMNNLLQKNCKNVNEGI